MLKIKLGLSRKKRVPVFYILDRTYLLHKALRKLWHLRRLNEIEHNKEYTILEAKANTLKLTSQHVYLVVDEWKDWERYYLPHFSLDGKTVLDVGAGCGETAFLFFLHGARKVIAVEPNSKAIEYLRENIQRNKWNVEVIPGCFSLEHLKLDFDFMKMDAEGCEELLLSLPRLDKPCVIEVHSNTLLNSFIEKGWERVYDMSNEIHLVKNTQSYSSL